MGAVLFFVCMTLVTGLLYPLVVTGVVQLAFPKQSNGSLIIRNEQIIGSELIAQSFEDPKYFWPRPSAAHFNTMPSGASNLAPTSEQFPKTPDKTTSASGLDPHITLEMAKSQIPRIAQVHKVSEEKLIALLEDKPLVNVLLTNLRLDNSLRDGNLP